MKLEFGEMAEFKMIQTICENAHDFARLIQFREMSRVSRDPANFDELAKFETIRSV
jgi:hypothetical protein